MTEFQRRIAAAAALTMSMSVCPVMAEETAKTEEKPADYYAAVLQKLSGPLYIWSDDPEEDPEQILFTIEGRLPKNAYIEVTSEEEETEDIDVLYSLRVSVFTDDGLKYEPDTELFFITIGTEEEEAEVYFAEEDEYVKCETSEMTKKGIRFETTIPCTFVIGIPVEEETE